MNFLAQLRSGGSNVGASHSRHGTARSGAYSHRSAKESVGRRVHAADGHSVSRNHDGGSAASRIGVGTVLVMLQESPDSPQPPPLRVQNKDGKIVPRDHFFLAVVAPDNDQALAFLAVQPAGTFVLVKETATGDIAVYVKFQAAVRSFTVLRNKEIKRAKPNEDLVEWGRAYRALNSPHAEAIACQSTLMTPIHRMYLPPDKYAYLERCWLHFLPQVQAIAFELCTQPYYMDEEIAMEDWSALILASRVPCVAFVSLDSCGFHLFNTTAIAAAAAAESSNSASASALSISAAASVPVRIVEFDIAACLISIADGAFRPSSFVTPVHFGSTKMYDAELGFAAIRENFLTPDRVALKEATTATSATPGGSGVATSAWQDLGPLTASGDAELQHLLAVRALVATMVPHEPLPEGLVDALARLHRFWAAQTLAQSRGRWRTPAKLKCVEQVLPFYLELLLATAATDAYVRRELGPGKPDLLPKLAAALAFDVRCMARRASDAAVARLVHHVLQTMALRASVPRALAALVSDLCIESARFRELFMRNRGASLLWKAIHTASVLDAVSLPLLLQTQQLQQAAQRVGAPLMGDLPKRRSSLFGGRRKSQNARTGGSRKSLAFNASIVLPVTFETTVQVFFRLNPLLVQLELAAQLKDAHFSGAATISRAMTATTTAAMTATASPSGSVRKASWGGPLRTATTATSTALGEMVLFIERLAFFLMADPSSPTWEKDVLQLLRMEDLYVHLHNEIASCVALCGDGDGDDEDDEDNAGDEAARDARARLESVVECVAALYRLETKRRRHATTLIGEKKYWFLFHLLRQPVRAYHERTRDQLRAAHAAGSEDADPSSLSAQDESADDAAGLAVLAWILPKLPRQLVTEFVLISLDDVLQATRILNECVQRRAGHGQTRPVRLARLLVRVLTAMLRRACDFDLQLLLVRVLASSGSSVPAVLQLLVKEATKHGPARFAVERELLAFGEAFVALATALPQLEKWHATRDPLYAQLENRDDVEGNEQRKTMLMATVLSPENGVADSDEILWYTIQDMLVPSRLALEAGHEPRARLGVVEAFYSKIVFMQSDALPACVRHREKLRASKLYLRVRARVFLSPVLESPRFAKAQLREFVELHWNFLYDLRGQYKSVCDEHDDEDDGAALRDACRSLALLHLRCLLALASRRGLLPVLDEAFLDFRTARELLRILQQGTTVRHHHHHHHHEAPPSTPSGLGPGLSLTLPGRVDAPASPVSPHAPTTTTVSFQASELLLSSPALHATAVLTILSCAVSEAHALNEHIVPRYFIPSNIEGSSLNLLPDEDLLLSLQRHLKAADSAALRGALQACLQEAELDQQFGPPGRAHAVRVLLKLLTPDSYDTRLYARGSETTAGAAASMRIAAHRESEASDSEDEGHEEKCDQVDAALPQDEEERLMARAQPREYVARGAFATVYRATPCVPSPLGSGGDVAIKVCAHQRSSGELCVAAEVFNEVVVLERLRGNLAATQLLDFGNNTAGSQSFELVLEHCPATLAQWRRSLDACVNGAGSDGVQAVGVPFRSLLSLALGAFVDVARAVAQIHADHVCHFDIKADNVLLRVEPATLTAQLLREHGAPDQETDEAAASVPRVCLADFGESVVLPPAHCDGLQLSRTRGTEAIKSPEMLSVKGGDAAASPRVGPASDVWSLGCLLFELLTEEVMFASDDWAQLYAHLVAAESTASRTSSMVAPVVREDHADKLLRVLAPKTDAEKALATIFLQFLESILTRNAAARPPLATVLAEAEAQRRMILALPAQPEDEAFVATCLASGGSGAGNGGATTAMSAEPAPLSLSHLRLPPTATGSTDGAGPLAARLFFNLYLARDARALREAVPASASAGATPASTSATATSETVDATPRGGRASDDGKSTLLGDALLRQELSALQVAIESRFSHFIYFCYDDVKRQVARDGGAGAELDAAPADVASSSMSSASSRHDDSGAFLEIVEGVGRTVFYFSRARVLACLQADGASATVGGGQYGARTTSAGNSLSSARAPADAAMAAAIATPSLVRLLLQHSRGILGTLQRHLRHQSSRVLLVPADYDALDAAARQQGVASPLAELTTATLLFFLTTGLALAPLEALGAFARECHALTPLPSERVLAPLLRLHEELVATARAAAAAERSLHARASVRCRCGDKVFSAPLPSRTATAAAAAMFSPPPVDADADAEVVWDPRETRLVVGGGDACGRGQWRVVDSLTVDRLDSLLRTVLRRQLGPGPAASTAPRGGRKSLGQLAAARGGHGSHSHGHGVGDSGALREHVPFVLHGLSEVAHVAADASTSAEGDAAAGAPWTLYECALCATRVCAVSTGMDNMALPL